MFNNPYINNYTPQANLDRINNQITELEKMKSQIQQNMQQPQPINLTQNFQSIPTNRELIKYANNIEEVVRESVIGDTPYFSRDMSIVWVKNAKNEIKTYELKEIMPLDEKDVQIQYLQSQIEELKGMIKNEQSNTNDIKSKISTNTSEDDDTVRTTIKESKPTSVSRISKSKTE